VQNSKENFPKGFRGTRIPMMMMTMIILIIKLRYLDT